MGGKSRKTGGVSKALVDRLLREGRRSKTRGATKVKGKKQSGGLGLLGSSKGEREES